MGIGMGIGDETRGSCTGVGDAEVKARDARSGNSRDFFFV